MDTTTNNVEESSMKPTKVKITTDYMLVTLKEMISSITHREFQFAVSGILISVILFLLSSFFLLGSYFVDIDIFPPNLGVFLLSFAIAFLEIYLWFLLGTKVTPKAAHYLVDNKLLKLVFTRGNVHYIEYVPEEKRKIAMPHILNKYIALIIAWVSLSAFLLQIIAGFIAGGNPSVIVNPGGDILLFLVRTLVIFLLVPLIFTFVYPVGWMLVDAKLKAYNSVTQLNWLVGKKVVNLTAGIITLGSLMGLGANVLTETAERLALIFDLVLFCLINVSLTVILIAVFYNVFFQGAFYRRICESIEIGFGKTSVTLVDEKGNPIKKETSEERHEEESSTKPEKEFVEPVEDAIEHPTETDE
jgi:hypothetical protein